MIPESHVPKYAQLACQPSGYRLRRFASDRLLCRCEREQRCAYDHENSNAYQFNAGDDVTQRLPAHKNGVSEAGPCGEGDQAAVRRWVADCQEQKDAERDVKAEHHGHGGILPHKDDHGISQSQKEHSHTGKRDLQTQFSIHVCLPSTCRVVAAVAEQAQAVER